MKTCLHRVFKRRRVYKEGVGNCEICLPHPDNSKCKDFLPMNVYYINVGGKDEKEMVSVSQEKNPPQEVL